MANQLGGNAGGQPLASRVVTPSSADIHTFTAKRAVSYITADGNTRSLWNILGLNGFPTAVSSLLPVGLRAYVRSFIVGSACHATDFAVYSGNGHTADSQAIRHAIYTDDGGFYPAAKIFDSGSVAGVGNGPSGSGLISLMSGGSLSLPSGMYHSVTMVNTQWNTDSRECHTFQGPMWSPGIFWKDVDGGTVDPVPLASSVGGWYYDMASFALPAVFPRASRVALFFTSGALDYAGPSVYSRFTT